MMPPLSAQDTLQVLRAKYEDALICVECGRLLATRRESYAKSDLTEAERLTYICHECRQASGEAQRLAVTRIARAKHAAQASAEARHRQAVDINPPPVGSPALGDYGAESVPNPAVYAGSEGGFLSTRSQPAVTSQHRGGRPRKHPTNRAARTVAQRAWRARKRQQSTPCEVPAHAL
jgi:hypothetical protein